MLREAAYGRLARVTAEFDAVRFAMTYVFDAWGADPVLPRQARQADVTMTELRRSAATLEATFALRMFAEFEAIVRDYWATGLHRRTRPDMRPLMDGIGRRRSMAPADLAAAHDVRGFRNRIVHGGPPAPSLDLDDCQHGLARYLRWLPQQW